MPERNKRRDEDDLTRAAQYLAQLEQEDAAKKPAYLPSRHPGARAALDRWNALPGEEKEQRWDEGKELGRIWDEGQGEVPNAPPTGRTPFFIGDKAIHPGDVKMPLPADIGAAMRMGRGAKEGPPQPASPKPAAPPAARKPAPSRPSVQVSQAGQGGGEAMLSRLKTSGPSFRPEVLEKVRAVSPLVAEHLGAQQAPPDALAEARAQANRSTLGTRLARAGAMANEALTGARYDRGAYDDLEADAQQPVNDLMLRRQMGREDEAAGFARAREGREADDAAREAALYDASSERSRTARAQLLLRFPDKAKRIPPERLGQMSAADVAEFLQGFNEDRGFERQVGQDAAAERRHGEEMRARAADRAESREFRRWQMQDAAQSRAEVGEAKRRDMLERQDEKDQADLAKRSQDAAMMKDDLDKVAPYVSGGGDIPGVGPLAAALPEFFISEEGTGLRQAATRLYRNVVRMESGQTVTPQEAATALESYGMGAGRSEAAFRKGMASLAQRAQSALRNIESGFNPAVVQRRAERGGTTSRDVQVPAMGTGRFKRDRNGILWEQMSDGSAREVR